MTYLQSIFYYDTKVFSRADSYDGHRKENKEQAFSAINKL
jgi:hypothetical protein